MTTVCTSLAHEFLTRVFELNNSGINMDSFNSIHIVRRSTNDKIYLVKFLARKYGIYISNYSRSLYLDNDIAIEYGLASPPTNAKYHSGTTVVKLNFKIHAEKKSTDRKTLLERYKTQEIQEKVTIQPKKVQEIDYFTQLFISPQSIDLFEF
jgi:hypothetical protein